MPDRDNNHDARLWSFVPDAYYENAKKALYSDTGDKYSALTKLTDNYHYNVQSVSATDSKRSRRTVLQSA